MGGMQWANLIGCREDNVVLCGAPIGRSCDVVRVVCTCGGPMDNIDVRAHSDVRPPAARP
jgi:hypothetical protein